MLLKYPITILLFWVFAVLQNSFLPYFNIFGQIPNLVFILFFILVFSENPQEHYYGFFLVILAGFLLDVFSSFYLGISIISLLVLYFLIKITNHFFQKSETKYAVFYFFSVFSLCFVLYYVLLYVLSLLFHSGFIFTLDIVIGLIYNITVAWLVFFIYKKFININNNNQLKLF